MARRIPIPERYAAAHQATDVVSRTLRVPPWQNFMPVPDKAALFTESFATVAAMSQGVQRIKVRKPGNANSVDPALLCEMQAPSEELDFRERKPDLFDNGVGKNYNGYRIAFVGGEGFCRIEDDGSESAAQPGEIARFKEDLARAAESDSKLRDYIDAAGLMSA